ncbi:hypothetical protein [Flavivirga jejuensis]|uniref:Outer membrane protein beta-barrel domain-containing protein n=1 Tax=Flavivirga jejuensis TaxID=870487 RepID=A0ABT8WRS8_9FLAO|nr:hypothetical protein [Flavivirga jejuensis]MDO5975611.1 hypothetical protein [Flavivirga jejuensis]
MRLKELFTLFFIISTQTIWSQIIEIDWEEQEKSIINGKLLTPVKHGEFHIFRVKNINRFLYKVTIEGNNIELETPIPTELQTLFRLSSDELNATSQTDNVDEATKDAEDKLSELRPNLEENLKGFSNFLSLKFYGANPNELQKLELDVKRKELQEKAEKFLEKADKFLDGIRKVSREVLELKIIKVKLVNLARTDINGEEIENNIIKNKLKPSNPKESHKNLQNEFIDLKKEYKEVEKLVEDTPLLSELKSTFEELENAHNTLDEEKVLLLYSEVNFLYTELLNEKNFRITSPAIQAQNDLINYVITAEPTRTSELGAYKNTKVIDFDVNVHGGLKVDFSVGPIFSFGESSRDEKFFYESSENEGFVTLRQRENNNSISPGLAAMMHFHGRPKKNTSFGGMFGIGAGFQGVEDVDLSFYLGGSLIWGKSQKIVFSGGVSYLSVDRLKSDEFEVGVEYVETGFDLNNVVEKVLKPSLFLSLSYNLTNRVKR